jgi:hypothetical protein
MVCTVGAKIVKKNKIIIIRMVYISEKYKIIFLNTANTKSEEVICFLKNTIIDEHSCEYCNGICVNDPEFFLSCDDVIKKIGKEKWDDYIKFTIVRNTFDRMIQSYIDNDGKKLYFTFNKYLLEDDYIVDNWKIYAINNEVQMDVFINFENLENELNDFFRQIGLRNRIEISKGNTIYQINKKNYLTIENIKLIENFFEKEIEYFNYVPIIK